LKGGQQGLHHVAELAAPATSPRVRRQVRQGATFALREEI